MVDFLILHNLKIHKIPSVAPSPKKTVVIELLFVNKFVLQKCQLLWELYSTMVWNL